MRDSGGEIMDRIEGLQFAVENISLERGHETSPPGHIRFDSNWRFEAYRETRAGQE